MPEGELNHGPRPPFPSDLTIVDLLAKHVDLTPDAFALVLVRTTSRAHGSTHAAGHSLFGIMS